MQAATKNAIRDQLEVIASGAGDFGDDDVFTFGDDDDMSMGYDTTAAAFVSYGLATGTPMIFSSRPLGTGSGTGFKVTDTGLLVTTAAAISAGTPGARMHVVGQLVLDSASDPTGAGTLRLPNDKDITWRNSADSGNFSFGVTSDDEYSFRYSIHTLLSIDWYKNIGIGTSTHGNNAQYVLGITNGTAPTTSPADMVQCWSADYAAGDARWYFMTEASTDKVIIGDGRVIATHIATSEDVTCAAESGTASLDVTASFIISDGDADTDEDTVSLADGVAGQVKIFTYKTDTDTGDTVNVTPASFGGNTKIVFDTEGEGCTMIFDGTNWNVVSNNGGVIS